MTKPTDHGSLWIAARRHAPDLGVRHDHYDPAAYSIRVTSLEADHDIYVIGTPGDLHAWALRVLACADQAAAAERKYAGPLLHGQPVEPATDDEFDL